MCYTWCFALVLCSFPQFTMLNCTELLLEIFHSQQSWTLLEYVIWLMYSKVSHLFLRCPQFTMLNCTSLLFVIVCTQQSCTLLEYCTRLTYSKVFHFFRCAIRGALPLCCAVFHNLLCWIARNCFLRYFILNRVELC